MHKQWLVIFDCHFQSTFLLLGYGVMVLAAWGKMDCVVKYLTFASCQIIKIKILACLFRAQRGCKCDQYTVVGLATETSMAVAKFWLDFTQTSSPDGKCDFFFQFQALSLSLSEITCKTHNWFNSNKSRTIEQLITMKKKNKERSCRFLVTWGKLPYRWTWIQFYLQ